MNYVDGKEINPVFFLSFFFLSYRIFVRALCFCYNVGRESINWTLRLALVLY